jgi:hypothetical protein
MTGFTINAEENFDPATVNAGFPNDFYNSDGQTYAGFTYDRNSRLILYGIGSYNRTTTNTTGFTLWSGQTQIAAGATYDGSSFDNHFIMARPVDLSPGTVVANPCYSSAKTVPVGTTSYRSISSFSRDSGGTGYVNGTYMMVPLTVTGTAQYVFASFTVSGGAINGVSIQISYKATVGDVLTVNNSYVGGSGSGFQLTVVSVDSFVATGAERRVTEFDNSGAGNGNAMVDGATGNLYMHALAGGRLPCIIYLLRKSASYALEISPMFPYDGGDRHMDLRAISQKYAYTLEYDNAFLGSDGLTWLVGTPRDIQAAESAVDYKLPYFWFQSPLSISFQAATPYLTTVTASSNNKLYLLFVQASGARNYKLYRFDEPSAAVPYNTGTTGGGFTDITPWSSSTGPNTFAAPYTTTNSRGTKFSQFYLPSTNQLAIVTRYFPGDKPSSPTQSDFFCDCTYVSTPDGSATMDYHHAFVAGFMDVNWNPLSSVGNVAPARAAWAVIDVQDMDSYLDVNSFRFPGFDYTQRWLIFTTLPCNPGDTIVPPPGVNVDNVNYVTIHILYQFTSGAPPIVVRFYSEYGWDTQLPLNSDFAGFPTGNAVVQLVGNGLANSTISGDFYTVGLYDSVTNAFWWPGQSGQMWGVSTVFSPRENFANHFDPAPPFLRLGFGSPPPPPAALRTQGHIF